MDRFRTFRCFLALTSMVIGCHLVSSQPIVFEEISNRVLVQHSYGDLPVISEGVSKFSGGGPSFCDFNGDGIDDLSLPGYRSNVQQFLANQADRFQAADVGVDVAIDEDAKQLLWVDIDNDGDADLFQVSQYDPCRLYERQDEALVDITEEAGLLLDGDLPMSAACWGDFDRDGLLDVYVAGYFSEINHPGRNTLFKNMGANRFVDVTEQSGLIDSNTISLACAFIDYDRDGWPDLYVSNDKKAYNRLYQNNRDGTFSDVSQASGADLVINAMNVGVGDYNNDGFLDIYVTNTPEGNVFLHNNGDGTFSDITAATSTAVEKLCWNGVFADVDNDGWEDLFVCVSNGFGKHARNPLFRNNGDGTFEEVFWGTHIDTTGLSYGAAMGDLNDDGYCDLAVLNADSTQSKVYENSGGFNHWIKIDLEGTISNRDAVGAWLRVVTSEQTHYRYRTCGSGYQSQNTSTILIGLGAVDRIDTLEVWWPSGRKEHRTNVRADQRLCLIEGFSDFVYADRSADYNLSLSAGFAQFGNGISAADFNRDGWEDLTFGTASGMPLRFFENTGSSFVEVHLLTEDPLGDAKQVLWLDYDNDDDLDLYVTYNGAANRLYRNDGSLDLSDATEDAGLSVDSAPTFGATFGDYDNDGFLDLYVVHRDVTENSNTLYRNNGDGRFIDVTNAMGVAYGLKPTFCASFFDADGDGYADLMTAEDKFFGNMFFRNQSGVHFEDVSHSSGAYIEMDAMNLAASDFDNDGDLDMYLTNTPSGNKLLVNDGNATFTEEAELRGLTFNILSWGAQFIDFDNDGDRDIYVCSGVNDPALKNALYEQNDNGSFVLRHASGLPKDYTSSYALATGDFNRDGRVDMVVSNSGAYDVQLWMGQDDEAGNWLQLALHGTQSNRDGIGAWIKVCAAGNCQWHYTQSAEGYLAQNAAMIHFGLGALDRMDSIRIDWPSGVTDMLTDVSVNQRIEVEEGMHTSTHSTSLPSHVPFLVFPNPSNDVLVIDELPAQPTRDWRFQIYDVKGRAVVPAFGTRESSRAVLDIAELQTGVYILLVSNVGESYRIRFVKNP